MRGEGEAEDASIFLRIMLLALPLPLLLPQWHGISLLAVDPASEAIEASEKHVEKSRRGGGNGRWGAVLGLWWDHVFPG